MGWAPGAAKEKRGWVWKHPSPPGRPIVTKSVRSINDQRRHPLHRLSWRRGYHGHGLTPYPPIHFLFPSLRPPGFSPWKVPDISAQYTPPPTHSFVTHPQDHSFFVHCIINLVGQLGRTFFTMFLDSRSSFHLTYRLLWGVSQNTHFTNNYNYGWTKKRTDWSNPDLHQRLSKETAKLFLILLPRGLTPAVKLEIC